jgi:hypothetical protein
MPKRMFNQTPISSHPTGAAIVFQTEIKVVPQSYLSNQVTMLG